MANAKQANPEYFVETNGKKRKLVLTLKSIMLAEEKRGISFFTAVNWQNLTVSDIALILWVALLDAEPETTLEDVKRDFALSDIFRVTGPLLELVDELLSRSLPTEDTSVVKKKAKTKQKAKR